MSAAPADLLEGMGSWLQKERRVHAAVLFGSAARLRAGQSPAASGSDLDFHIVTSDPSGLERVDWSRALPRHGFCLQAVRSATGGVRKVTLIFAAGVVDLVLVPAPRLSRIRNQIRRGTRNATSALRPALNELATCLHSGFRFVKGEDNWGAFYRQVAGGMPGVRMSDAEIRGIADVFLCDLLWIVRKIGVGELTAAQHLLHRSLSETNLRLVRELRLRRGSPLPSFGLGRRAERLYSSLERRAVRVNAGLSRRDLDRAARGSLDGLLSIMCRLAPRWRIPAAMRRLPEFRRLRPGR